MLRYPVISDRTGAIPNNITNGISNTNTWVETTVIIIGGTEYSWTTDGIPTDWGNSNYVLPTRAFLIAFCNEVSPDYHNNSLSLQLQPSTNYNNDFSEFVGNFNSMDYFGGILYPVPGNSQGNLNTVDASALLQAYAAIENVDVVNQAGLEPAVTSTTYTDMVNPWYVTSTK